MLHLIVLSEYSAFEGQEGHYVADALQPFVARVEALVRSPRFLETW